ncbi:polysaccharide deacetylase family protein [Paenibacillus lignilyticus]|uniref:Polysaccharide deacetylase family protein n=1 Tax=Paenibacillus lignilyticus TaxID=1172615 RepID=A0ABS5CDA8_9BACL|nr:polysaccharide deacetylase family protein [Paenibacillus lignilyticus]MBP3963936.1 polysaccharide deacetylase family protein [Paenibacillus lignilyticus]
MKAASIFNEVKTADKLLAITFDDGPNPEWTPQFLRVFQQYGAKATFYVHGTNMEKYPDVAQRMDEEGHEFGNHSYSHPHMASLSKEEQTEELRRAEQIIVAVIGKRPSTFRPPYLEYNDDLLAVCEQFGYPVIHATNLDTRDWDMPGTEHIVNVTRAEVRAGSILLFHDGFGDRSQSLAAIQILVPELIEQGFKLVTISELLATETT